MDFEVNPADEAFRLECRAFLREHLPQDVARRGRRDFHPRRDDVQFWTRTLNTRGWSTPHWPVDYGGPDWTPIQKFIFEEEMRRGFAPVSDRIGTDLVGPVIYTFGTEAQKARYLPAIRNSDEFWCQGFSEPGSGSDLSSLRTKATREGEYYIISGQKTWTTEAHNADMMIALVRTNAEVKPQQGISVLLVDMKSPDVIRRPIYTIDEGLSVNEVFFDDVRVPTENLVGKEGDGWTIAKFLLTNERTVSAEVPHTKRDIAQIEEIARVERKNGKPLIHDAVFASKLARLKIETLALEYAVLRVLTGDRQTQQTSAVASVLKTRGAELRQRAADLAVDAIGDCGVAMTPDPEGLHNLRDDNLSPPTPEHGIGLTSRAMFRRATTIYGGANEIQRTLIAKTVLEL